MSDIQMSQNEIKGFTSQTSKMKSEERTYPSKPQGKGSPNDVAK